MFFSIWTRRGTLIIGDSRCCSLPRSFVGDDIRCYAYRGAGIRTICVRARELIHQQNPVTCLLLCGINNVTVMNKHSRVIRLRYIDSFDLANYITMLILQARSELTLLFPGTKIIFGGIIGVSLNTYNGMTGVSNYSKSLMMR